MTCDSVRLRTVIDLSMVDENPPEIVMTHDILAKLRYAQECEVCNKVLEHLSSKRDQDYLNKSLHLKSIYALKTNYLDKFDENSRALMVTRFKKYSLP